MAGKWNGEEAFLEFESEYTKESFYKMSRILLFSSYSNSAIWRWNETVLGLFASYGFTPKGILRICKNGVSQRDLKRLSLPDCANKYIFYEYDITQADIRELGRWGIEYEKKNYPIKQVRIRKTFSNVIDLASRRSKKAALACEM